MLRHKKAEDISLFYLVILLIDLGLWIRYGFPREDNLVVVTNGFALVINGIIIVAGTGTNGTTTQQGIEDQKIMRRLRRIGAGKIFAQIE